MMATHITNDRLLMDFFEAKDQAKSSTTKLVILFALAVISIILVTNFFILLAFRFVGDGTTAGLMQGGYVGFSWEVFAAVGGIISVVVVIGSLYKIFTLRGGGARIAENLGGELIVSGTDDLKKQQLLNVVEEMAIASGTPVPPVYLIKEEGINAFAAGYEPSDAVIGITQGALNTLDREELQGVIAHEFSHILHGDMRLNLKLVGFLHGILILRLIGEVLIRGNRSSSRSKRDARLGIIGLVLIIVGWIGFYFGGLIKAAVSRQREYLADASAVQFTRNPNGIAAALMKINKHSQLSFIENPAGREFNHAFFEAGSRADLRGLGATHPPIKDRIGAILPNWDGSYDLIQDFLRGETSGVDAWAEQQGREKQDTNENDNAATKAEALTGGITSVILADALLNQVGNPTPAHIDYADSVLHSIPEPMLKAAHDPSGARAVIYLLVLSKNDQVRADQMRQLETSADLGVLDEVQALINSNGELNSEQRLPLATIAISTLRQLSPEQYKRFKDNFHSLVTADKRINLMEWALQKIVFHTLDANFDTNKRRKIGKRSLKAVKQPMSVLLSMLAQSSSQEGLSSEEAFARGVQKANIDLSFIEKQDISFKKLDSAIDALSELKPLQMPLLLKACVETVSADNQIKPIEMELVRAIAAVLDCPMPPLIPQHKPQ